MENYLRFIAVKIKKKLANTLRVYFMKVSIILKG